MSSMQGQIAQLKNTVKQLREHNKGLKSKLAAKKRAGVFIIALSVAAGIGMGYRLGLDQTPSPFPPSAASVNINGMSCHEFSAGNYECGSH